jgi:hypothetical protein
MDRSWQYRTVQCIYTMAMLKLNLFQDFVNIINTDINDSGL